MALFVMVLSGPSAEEAEAVIAVSDPHIVRTVLRAIARVGKTVPPAGTASAARSELPKSPIPLHRTGRRP